MPHWPAVWKDTTHHWIIDRPDYRPVALMTRSPHWPSEPGWKDIEPRSAPVTRRHFIASTREKVAAFDLGRRAWQEQLPLGSNPFDAGTDERRKWDEGWRAETLPVAVATDVLTLGGTIDDNGETHTAEALRKLKDEADEDD